MSGEMYEVGKIVNTHGIKGEVRVISTTDFSERFTVGKTLYLVNKNDPPQKLIINGHRMHKQFDLIHFEGFDNINDVEHFKGAHLKIKEEQLTDLNKGEYYYHQIVGCIMYTTSGEKLGNITGILSPGANDVWIVKRPSGKDVLIPAIKDVIMEVDIIEKKVIIELMEGLLD